MVQRARETHAVGGEARPGRRLGFVGTGNLGSQIVARLTAAGNEVAVHDADRSAAEASVASGAVWAESPSAVAEHADTVFTCLPRPEVVLDVVGGADGVLGALRPGGCWVDLSTNDVAVLQELGEVAARRGIGVLEAPVTGGVHKAAAGELTVLVGGERELYEAERPLLEQVGSRVIYLGHLGQASRMKVITNMLAFIHLVAAGEALVLAGRAGIDLGDAFESIRASSGNSFVHETESQLILSGSYHVGFTVDLALKDLDLVRRLADDLGVPVELGAAVARQFERARGRYGGGAWSPRVVQLLEDEVGFPLRADGFPLSLLDGTGSLA